MLEFGVERENEKPRCFWAEWTLGSLTAIPPSNREHLVKLPEEWKILTLRSDPSHQFLVSNSSVLLPTLPVFGKDCLGGRSVREKNHHQPPSERERVCIVRANCGSGCERGMHDKHSSSPDILMDEPGMGIYTTEQPTTENTESSERKKNRDVSFRHSGRRSDDSDRVFDVRGTEEYRNIRFDSSNSSDAEPDTTPKNKRSGKKSYLITITNRYIYFPLQSALLHRGNGGYISHDLTEGLLVAVLDQSTLPITEPSHNHDKFASHANPTIRDPSNETHILVSILGDQNRLNGGYLPISPRIPLGASLADGGGEERLPRIVREGLIKTTCWKDEEGNSEGYFRIAGHRIDTATNRRESIQSEIHTIRSIFHKSVDILLRSGRNPFYHPESQIRTFWMDGSFRDAASGGAINQHPLDRWGTGEIKNWLNYHRSRGDREKYVDLDSDVYEWSDHVKGSRVLPKDSAAPKQNYSMMIYNRIGFPTDQDPTGWSRGSGMKYPKFSLIRERFEFLIRGSGNAGSPSNPTNTMIVHPAETNGSFSGNYKPSQFFLPESIAPPPSLSGTVNRSITDPFQIRSEPDDATRCTGGPFGNTTSAASRGYDWFHPAKRVDKGSLKACSYGANTPKSLDYSHLGRGGWPSSRNHNIEGNPRNHDPAYGQSRNILSFYILPIPAERPFLLPDRKIISVIQSQISKILSPNHSEGCDRPFAFAHNLYKLFDLSNQTDSPIHGKTSIDPTRNFSITTPLKGKRIGNLELGITYCWPHTRAEVITPVGKKCHDSPNDGKALSSSGFTRNQSRTDKGVRIRNKPDDTLYRIGESSRSSTEDSRNVIGNGVTDGESTSFDSFEDGTTYPTLSPHPDKLVGGTEMCMVPRGGRGNAFGRYDLFRAYTPRFLTHERRRKYLNNAIPETIANILPKSNDHINMMNVRGVKIIDGQPPCKPIFEWLLRNDCNNDEYLIMGSLLSALSVLRKGSDYIDLWRRLGIIRYLIDPLRKYQLDRLMHRDMIRHSIGGRQNRFPSPNIKHSVKNRGYYSLTRDRINRWLDGNKGLDLYPPVRVPPIQFLVTDGNISRHELSIIYNHNFFNNDSGYRTTQEQGLCHSRYLAGSYDKDMMNYPLQHSDSRNWVFPAPRQRITPLNYTSRIPPVPLQSGFPPSKGISPVGPVETGRSYPTNDLAADFDAPSIPISMSDSYKNERHIMVNDIKINGVKLLATSLRRLILILGLVERMSPRIIRIRDMHELNVKRERLTRPEIGTDFAPHSSLILPTGLASHAKRMIVIGPTHLPGETDPSLICSNRSDRSINIRMLSIPRRQKEFPVPLRSKRFNLADKNLSCLNAFGYRIMCYYARDLASLANEALLISICHSVPHDNAIGSVLLRQVVSGHDTYVDTSPNYPGRYVSRVGKATMHSIVVGIVPTSPSYGSEMKDPLSERRFDYSSEWYSESSIAETTVGEFTILSRALGCLARSAARYSRFVPENQRDDSIHFVRCAEYDSTSARTALENLVAGFPRLEIHKGKSIDGEIGFAPCPRTRAPPGTMREATAILAIPSLVLDREGYGMTDGTTARAPAQRLRLPVSNISDWMKAAPVRGGKQTTCDHSQMNLDFVHAPCYPLCHAYKRILFQRLLRIIKEIGSQSGGMPLKDRFGILGVYIPKCGVEYQLPNKPVLFTGKRFVWDPGSLPRNCKFAFSHRELFIDEGGLMLKGLHAARRSKIGFGRGTKIKQFSALHFAPGGQSIETLKRTDKIGVQSKHTHLFYPVYLYQAWVTESPDTFAHFELPNNCERWLGVGSPPNALFTHSILSESYRYLLKTFLANRVLLSQAIGVFSTDQ
uniref:Hypothetical chloroplast RF21 n=1 Tax=Selaginella nummulariifolia TaxID=1715387 RepID=A0A650FH11_9TRAC|nr:hypothetical chloroplast RF21 [Selaginella nummulariifolia]